MKLLPLLISATMLCSAEAEPVDLWAHNVTEHSGWRDYNKNFNGQDNEQCWAIAAANLIDWWQELRPGQLPPQTPRGTEILRHFTHSFTNAGSDPDEAIYWWFNGEYKPGRPDCSALRPNCPGGFLKSLLPKDKEIRGTLLISMRGEQVNAASATAALIEGAKKGAAFWVGVSYISPIGRPAMHSLNVWGVRYETSENAPPRLCGIRIADSDDRLHGITYIPLKVDKDMLIFDCPQHPLYGKMPRIELDTITILQPPEQQADK